MVRRIRYSMLAVMIVALCAVIAFSATRFQQPAPPKNDLERLGLEGPMKSVLYTRGGYNAVKYVFDQSGNVFEEITYLDNQIHENTYYSYSDDGSLSTISTMNSQRVTIDDRRAERGDPLNRAPLFLSIPVVQSASVKDDYVVRLFPSRYDQHGNWSSRSVKLYHAKAKGNYLPNIAYSWVDCQIIEYKTGHPIFRDEPTFPVIQLPMTFQERNREPASIEFLPVP